MLNQLSFILKIHLIIIIIFTSNALVFSQNDCYSCDTIKNIIYPNCIFLNFGKVINKIPYTKNQINNNILKKDLLLNKTPFDLVVPGEFEEVQAILISWPFFAFDSSGFLIIPYTKGYGLKQVADSYKLVPIANYKLNLVVESPIVKIFEQITNEVQKESQIWIRIPNDGDSLILKEWFDKRGNHLHNYKFIVSKDGANYFWMRDCGPICGYYSNLDSIALIDFEYYANAPIDDELPYLISENTNYKVFKSSIEIEGGNFITDGCSNGFSTSVIYESNGDSIGMTYTNKVPLSNYETERELRSVLNLQSLSILDKMHCDGGTGHLDFFAKFLDETTILLNKFPNDYDNQYFPDFEILEKDKEKLNSLESIYGVKYNIIDLDIPPSDDGGYNRIDCDSYSLDPRTFVNSLFVNKTLIYPIYSNEFDGYNVSDEFAKEIYEQLLPGYNIIGIDCRGLIRSGGAIHCLAMQIPAENPIRIYHKRFYNGINLTPNIKIEATIQSNKKITQAYCFWQKNGESLWNSIILSNDSNHYQANICLDNISNNDTVNYYLMATNSDGKSISKPITAPNGFYTITFNPNQIDQELSAMLFPNPVIDHSFLIIQTSKRCVVNAYIYDCLGKIINRVINEKPVTGKLIKQLIIENLAIGMYYLIIKSENLQIAIPFIKMK